MTIYKRSVFYGLILTIMSCSYVGKNESENSLVGKLLPPGTYQFEILDSTNISPEQEELTYAFQQAYLEKMDSFNLYLEKVRNNEEGKFPENSYITEEELQRLFAYSEGIKVLPSGTETVKVYYSLGEINFISDGKLDILNHLHYRSENNVFFVDNNYLRFKDSVVVNDSDNALQEGWKGYNWEMTDPDTLNRITQEMLPTISFTHYKVTIGTLAKSGRLFLIIKGHEIRNGQTLQQFEIPIRMKQ